MNASRITVIESGHRIHIPAEWAEALHLEHVAALEKTPEGILIRPVTTRNWDEIFATKLQVAAVPSSDELEVRGDDLLF